MNEETRQKKDGDDRQGKSWLEWFAGGVGLLLALVLIGTIGYQAVRGDSSSPPQLEFDVSSVGPSGNYYLVEVEARNRTEATAQQVNVEVTLTREGQEVQTAQLTFDYVPGGSKVKGGVYFSKDPGTGKLSVRPLGYSQP